MPHSLWCPPSPPCVLTQCSVPAIISEDLTQNWKWFRVRGLGHDYKGRKGGILQEDIWGRLETARAVSFHFLSKASVWIMCCLIFPPKTVKWNWTFSSSQEHCANACPSFHPNPPFSSYPCLPPLSKFSSHRWSWLPQSWWINLAPLVFCSQ